MTLYVITESFFGNTRRIGEVIATELDVVLYGAASAPTDFADGDAVIVGAPTHNGPRPRLVRKRWPWKVRGCMTTALDFWNGWKKFVATVAVSARRPLTPLYLVVRGLVLLRSDQ